MLSWKSRVFHQKKKKKSWKSRGMSKKRKMLVLLAIFLQIFKKKDLGQAGKK